MLIRAGIDFLDQIDLFFAELTPKCFSGGLSTPNNEIPKLVQPNTQLQNFYSFGWR